MGIPVMGLGLWNKYSLEDHDEIARRERCERDTRLDMSGQEHKTEGHRPCGCPERYRKLTPAEREQLDNIIEDL